MNNHPIRKPKAHQVAFDSSTQRVNAEFEHKFGGCDSAGYRLYGGYGSGILYVDTMRRFSFRFGCEVGSKKHVTKFFVDMFPLRKRGSRNIKLEVKFQIGFQEPTTCSSCTLKVTHIYGSQKATRFAQPIVGGTKLRSVNVAPMSVKILDAQLTQSKEKFKEAGKVGALPIADGNQRPAHQVQRFARAAPGIGGARGGFAAEGAARGRAVRGFGAAGNGRFAEFDAEGQDIFGGLGFDRFDRFGVRERHERAVDRLGEGLEDFDMNEDEHEVAAQRGRFGFGA